MLLVCLLRHRNWAWTGRAKKEIKYGQRGPRTKIKCRQGNAEQKYRIFCVTRHKQDSLEKQYTEVRNTQNTRIRGLLQMRSSKHGFICAPILRLQWRIQFSTGAMLQPSGLPKSDKLPTSVNCKSKRFFPLQQLQTTAGVAAESPSDPRIRTTTAASKAYDIAKKFPCSFKFVMLS